ncbi:MAG TPA: glycosyltransferase family 4 protein [Gemmataceae bacterium]|nr:glycosyltransferase family 4 protein [Gemmataceae bacterium]
MRIAQVAPLYESVPPHNYGGTERVVSYLTEELVRLGHEVTLFASGDSATSARLVAGSKRSLRTDKSSVDKMAPHLVMLEEVLRRVREFDLVHFHVDYLHFPFSRRLACPHLTTLHGRLDIPELLPVYQEYGDMPVVSISHSQRQPQPHAKWVGTVYHGLPEALHTFRAQPRGDYLAFIGRISPEKRVDRAIAIAKQVGMKLKIAAKIDRADRAYYKREIEPLFDDSQVEFLGEQGGAAKDDFLGNARALLFPIDWPEPFGLVMIEAMACGTPVIAWPNGSVPEVIDDGVTGIVVDNVDAAAKAVRRVGLLSRRTCREVFLKRFTDRRMAADYLRIYHKLAGRRAPSLIAVNHPPKRFVRVT